MKIIRWLLFAILILVSVPFGVLGILGVLGLALSILGLALALIIPISLSFLLAGVGIIFAIEMID